ncbi:MAG: hypothetical protein ACRDD8_06355 [Bacteroidales bacterium]
MVIKEIVEIKNNGQSQRFRSTVWYGQDTFKIKFSAMMDPQENTIWKLSDFSEDTGKYLNKAFINQFKKQSEKIQVCAR